MPCAGNGGKKDKHRQTMTNDRDRLTEIYRNASGIFMDILGLITDNMRMLSFVLPVVASRGCSLAEQ